MDDQSIYLLRQIQLCNNADNDSALAPCSGTNIGSSISPNAFSSQLPIWLQTSVFLQDNYQNVMALKIGGFRGAHRVYWDGHLIAQNGRIDPKATEHEFGRYQFYAIIPTKLLTKGEHLLRIEHLKLGETLYDSAYILFGNYVSMSNADLAANNKMVLMLMVFITSTVFFLIFYFGFGRKTSFLFLSAYCLAYSIKSILKPYQDFYTPDFLIPFMSYKLSHLPANLGSVFLIAFLLWEMAVPRKFELLLIFATLSIWGYYGLTESQYLIMVMLVAGAIVCYGTIHKIEGIGWAIIGMIGFASLISSWILGYYSYGYFAGVIFFLVCMTFSVGQRIAKQIQLKQAAQLRSSTLENQLLKKSIQPHFILNALTSLQELIDQSPEKATDFVEQLAEEFKLISKMSNKQQILIKDELEMCRTHLKIMEYRKNATFQLITKGISEDETVPPGIFHTLIENGITHGYGNRNDGFFLLNKIQTNDHTEYVLFNNSEVESDNRALVKGTGLKYVEARLQETYGDKWTLTSQALDDGWEVRIVLKAK